MNQPTILDLVTAARVSTSILESELESLARRLNPRPPALTKAIETNRTLWARIDALAAVIEDQAAEIERLNLHLSPRAGDDSALSGDYDLSGDSDLSDEPDSDLSDEPESAVAIEVPVDRGEPLESRPPGFAKVRRRMLRPSNPAAGGIAVIKAAAEKGAAPRQKKHFSARCVGVNPLKEPTWKRLERAVLEGKLPTNCDIPKSRLIKQIGASCGMLTNLHMDLAAHRSLIRLREIDASLVRIVYG